MNRKNKKGFTLLELIIVLAILGIVISMSFSFFSFGNRIFSKGEAQSNIQHSVRMASRYITDEIRTAKDVRLLEKKPVSFGDFNYIYIEGTKIIHKKPDGTFREVFGSTDVGPVILDFKSTNGDKVVEFIISKKIKDQNFEVESKVAPLNLTATDTIEKETSADGKWRAIRYSDPIKDPGAIVRLDTLLLDLKKLNAYLDVEGDTLVLDVPTKRPNRINLPVKGEMGADISWSTTSAYIVTSGSNIGTVYRRLWNDIIDETFTLKATISKGEGTSKVEKEKEFKIKIKRLEELKFVDATLSLTVKSGEYFSHQIMAEGGNPGYNFSASNNVPEGLTLEPNGVLSGIITLHEEQTSNIFLNFNIALEDSHLNISGNDAPNTITGISFNLTVEP